MNHWFFLLSIIVLIFPLETALATQGNYLLEIDTHSYNISYSFEGKLIAMAIDNELNSLLIGIEDVSDSIFEITLPNEMISAENNDFAVLVNGLEVDYVLTPISSGVIMQFSILSGTEEIEIIGTHVIPEFPLGFLIVFPTLFALMIFLTRKNFLIK